MLIENIDEKKLIAALDAVTEFIAAMKQKIEELKSKSPLGDYDRERIERGTKKLDEAEKLKAALAAIWLAGSDLAEHSPEFKKHFEEPDQN